MRKQKKKIKTFWVTGVLLRVTRHMCRIKCGEQSFSVPRFLIENNRELPGCSQRLFLINDAYEHKDREKMKALTTEEVQRLLNNVASV